MKQFLRFQISGLTCLFWLFLYYLPCINWKNVNSESIETVIPVLAVAVALALPLGTIIHQISISLLSPFRSRRFFFQKRLSLEELKNFSPLVMPTSNSNHQYKMAVIQSYTIETNNTDGARINIQELQSEVSARYSYYYVRVDNGLIAPLISMATFFISIHMLKIKESTLILDNSYSPTILIIVFTLVFMFTMLCYVPTLLAEIDDLEKFMIRYALHKLH